MPDEIQEELTAYLDGELDPAGSHRVEERLKHDPAYRAELARLEQAWRMLDQLDRAVVGENFTRTTLEMVATAAATDAKKSANRWSKPAILGAAVLVAACGLLGVACGTWIWPDPNRQLLHELPILESIDLYEQGDSIEFLRKLERAGIFDQQPGDPAAAVSMPDTSGDDALDERRSEIERMTPPERQQLRHNQERFNRYSLADRQKMLRLLDDLDRDPHEDELRRVMIRYHEWLDTLPLSTRSELTDLPADERMEKIAALQRQQAAEQARELSDAPTQGDMQAIVQRIEDYAWQNRHALLATLSPARQQYIERLDELNQRRAVLWLAAHQAQPGGKARLPQWDAATLADVAGKLSLGARRRIGALASEKDKQKLVGTWIQTALRHRVELGGIRQTLPSIDAAELQRFLREEFTSAQRERMLLLARDQRHRLLLRMYFFPPERLAQLEPAHWPGWPQTAPSKAKPEGKRPKAGKQPKQDAKPPQDDA